MPLPPPTHSCPFALLKNEDPPAHVAIGAYSNAISLRVTAACLASRGLFQPLSLAALPYSSVITADVVPHTEPTTVLLPSRLPVSGTVTTTFHFPLHVTPASGLP